MTSLILIGPPAPQRHPGHAGRRALRHPAHLHRRDLPRQRLAGHRPWPRGQGVHGPGRVRAGLGDQRHGARTAGRADTENGFLLDGYPAPCRRWMSWTSSWPTWATSGRRRRDHADPAEVTARLLPGPPGGPRPTTPKRSSPAGCRCTPSRPSRSWPSTRSVAWCARWTGWARSKRSTSASSPRSAADPPRAPARAARQAKAGDQRPLSSWPLCARLVWSWPRPAGDRGRPVAPGTTTGQLDAIAQEVIADAGAQPSFPRLPGLPGAHLRERERRGRAWDTGDRVLAEGDLVSIDCGAIVRGWHGDAAVTVFAGAPGSRPPSV